jgi:hypothetical protein
MQQATAEPPDTAFDSCRERSAFFFAEALHERIGAEATDNMVLFKKVSYCIAQQMAELGHIRR